MEILGEIKDDKISNKIYFHDKFRLIGFIAPTLITLFRMNEDFSFSKIFKSKVSHHKKINWLGFIHFGTSSSTINKYENTVGLIVNSEHSSSSVMIDEKK